MTDPARLTATEAARAIAAGTLTPATLMEACLARAAAREPVVRAFVHLDPEQARRAAAAARPGPLHGLPFGVKDVLDTAQSPTGYGSPIWAGHRPRGDSAAVAAARAAGGVIMGKTVTTEFATRHPGPTTNPHNAAHTPGGSSSGSAAAVADCMVPLAFGTQTAGSIVRPAAYCGVVGFKPTYGTIHRGGMKVCSESLDTIGIMARSVADIALGMTGLTGRDHGDPEAKRAAPPRLLLSLGHAPEAAAPETVALLERAAAAARAAGAEVVESPLPEALRLAAELHPFMMNMETRQGLAWEYAEARHQMSAVLLDRMDWASGFPPAKLGEARRAAVAARAAFAEWTAGFDAVLTPSAPGEAPEGLAYTGDATFNLLWTLLYGPNVTVPVGTGPKGLPLGVQLAGRIAEDPAVLATARWVQAAMA
ncbi:amidase [Falsiroseomonas selenitidurans]|uniref:Amidase n=1 Tax=Falsiroseomonas selenitidurans TaxID=2716335 RepID=A0ABX1E329_9PROT|nr:amidase [Falsiroseomonas selenitidurans]NKC31574.1 amidase [Falsiroseomonas selenitidurans]